MAITENRNIAIFCDFENVAIGLKEANYPDFKIRPILERLLLKGSIVVKKAYCDWDRYRDFRRDMHEAAFELIEIPHVRQSGKNSADIRMVVDALDLCYTKSHIDAFVIISGDSDFSPLISKLKENGKSVIGIGVRGSASSLLISNCDEFIFYEDLPLPRQPQSVPARSSSAPKAGKDIAKGGTKPIGPATRPEKPALEKAVPDDEVGTASVSELSAKEKKNQAIEIVVETVEQLVAERGGEGYISASLIKSTIKRIRPGFSESEYGYSAFGKILDDAHKKGALVVERKEGGAVNVGMPVSRA
ncbi:MAG: NYN domain-containing protein [Thiobacillaceae bacterium]